MVSRRDTSTILLSFELTIFAALGLTKVKYFLNLYQAQHTILHMVISLASIVLYCFLAEAGNNHVLSADSLTC